MTVGTSSTTTSTSTITPIFLEIGVNGDMQKAVNEKKPLSIILFDAFCPAKPPEGQVFHRIISPREPVSPEATARYGISAAQTAQSPQFAAVWQQFRDWAGNGRVIIVAHQFYKLSLKFLDSEAANAGVEVPSNWVKFDPSYLASFLDEYRDEGKKSLPEICTQKAISLTGNTGRDVYKLLSKMASPTALETLYPLMLADPKHPIKPVGDYLKLKQTAAKTSSTALRIIYFDLETTGLRQEGNEPHIVEISAYDPKRNEYFTRLVNPEMFIPAEASRIHGITDGMVNGVFYDQQQRKYFEAQYDSKKLAYFKTTGERVDGATCTAYRIKEMLTEFIPWAEAPINGVKPKVILVGYNSAAYDFPVLKAEGERGGVEVPYNWYSFDIFRLVNTLRIKAEPNRKLQTLREKFGIPPTVAHRAQGDTEVTYKLALKLFGNANIDTVYKEIATPGAGPYIRVADIIRAAGGPADFASGVSSVAPPATGKRKVAPVKAPAALELSASQDSESDSPTVKRKPAASTLQKVVTKATNSDLAIKIAAKMAIEMAALMGTSSTATTTTTAEEDQPAPAPIQPTRRLRPRSLAAAPKPSLPVLPVRKLIDDSDDDTITMAEDSDSSTIEIA